MFYSNHLLVLHSLCAYVHVCMHACMHVVLHTCTRTSIWTLKNLFMMEENKEKKLNYLEQISFTLIRPGHNADRHFWNCFLFNLSLEKKTIALQAALRSFIHQYTMAKCERQTDWTDKHTHATVTLFMFMH